MLLFSKMLMFSKWPLACTAAAGPSLLRELAAVVRYEKKCIDWGYAAPPTAFTCIFVAQQLCRREDDLTALSAVHFVMYIWYKGSPVLLLNPCWVESDTNLTSPLQANQEKMSRYRHGEVSCKRPWQSRKAPSGVGPRNTQHCSGTGQTPLHLDPLARQGGGIRSTCFGYRLLLLQS